MLIALIGSLCIDSIPVSLSFKWKEPLLATLQYFLYTTSRIRDFDAKSKRQVSSPFLKADGQSLWWREHFETAGFIQRALHKYIIMNELIRQSSDFLREMGLQLPNLWVYIPHKIMWLLTVAASHCSLDSLLFLTLREFLFLFFKSILHLEDIFLPF